MQSTVASITHANISHCLFIHRFEPIAICCTAARATSMPQHTASTPLQVRYSPSLAPPSAAVCSCNCSALARARVRACVCVCGRMYTGLVLLPPTPFVLLVCWIVRCVFSLFWQMSFHVAFLGRTKPSSQSLMRCGKRSRVGWQRERQRERDTHTHRHTDAQMYEHTNTHTQTHTHKHRHTDTQTCTRARDSCFSMCAVSLTQRYADVGRI